MQQKNGTDSFFYQSYLSAFLLVSENFHRAKERDWRTLENKKTPDPQTSKPKWEDVGRKWIKGGRQKKDTERGKGKGQEDSAVG